MCRGLATLKLCQCKLGCGQQLTHACLRQRDSAQQKDALELELIALKKSAASATPRQPPARRGSQVMFGADQGGQMSATAAAAEAKADRLARELEEAEEEISAMSSKMRQQVS